MMPEEIRHINRTYRKSFAKHAIVPKIVQGLIGGTKAKTINVLDFGCGEEGHHVIALAQRFGDKIWIMGYDVCEAGSYLVNRHGASMETALKIWTGHLPFHRFDIVYASNVFNTHLNEHMSECAMLQIERSMVQHGLFLVNLTESPRYFWKKSTEFESFLGHFDFRFVMEIQKNVWLCEKN